MTDPEAPTLLLMFPLEAQPLVRTWASDDGENRRLADWILRRGGNAECADRLLDLLAAIRDAEPAPD